MHYKYTWACFHLRTVPHGRGRSRPVVLISFKVRSLCVRPFWYQYPFQYPCQFPCPSQRSHSSVLFWWTVSFLFSFLYFGRQNTCIQLFRSTWKILFAAGVRQFDHLRHFHRYCRKICWSCVMWHVDSDLCGEYIYNQCKYCWMLQRLTCHHLGGECVGYSRKF